MDPRTFDRLTRLIGVERSRRGVLKAVAGGAIGAMAAAMGRGETEAAAKRSVGNSCNVNADCASGHCVQEARGRKICHCQSVADCPAAKDVCHSVACLPTGYCGLSINAGVACDDKNACTKTDVCDRQGRCVGGNPIVCVASDQCHVAGTCDPATGRCSNPASPDGSACGSGQQCCGGTCCPNAGDVCVAGGCCTPETAAATCAGICGAAINNCGQTVDCGGDVGAPCTVTYYTNIPGEDPPIGFPGIGCCAGLVCQGSPFPLDAPKPGSCQVNQTPTAITTNAKFPWQQGCFPVTMWGYDPDNNPVLLQPVTPPANGFLTDFPNVIVPAAGSFGSAAPGVRALLAIDAGHTCLDGQPAPEPNAGLGDAGNIPLAFANNAPQYQCAEGTYVSRTTCYVPFAPTFTGNDSFSYTATDIFGSVSEPVIFSLTIFNPS